MKTRVGHVGHDPYDVYVGRGSPWGNPFVRRGKAKDSAYNVIEVDDPISAYEAYIRQERPELLARVSTLKGKLLGCWCYRLGERLPTPERCHAQVLARLAEGDAPAQPLGCPQEPDLCGRDGCSQPAVEEAPDGTGVCLLHALG